MMRRLTALRVTLEGMALAAVPQAHVLAIVPLVGIRSRALQLAQTQTAASLVIQVDTLLLSGVM